MAFTETKVPSRKEAEMFLKHWGQHFSNSPTQGGIPVDVRSGKENAVKGVALCDALSGLWYAHHSNPDMDKDGYFYNASGRMAQVAIALRGVRDGQSFNDKALKEAYEAFCQFASCFRQNSDDWNLVALAMKSYPGLEKAALQVVPEVARDMRGIYGFAASGEKLDLTDGQGVYENLRIIANTIDLKIKYLNIGEPGKFELVLDEKHLSDPDAGKRLMALLQAIDNKTECSIGSISLNDKGKATFQLDEGTSGDLLVMNLREVGALAQLLFKNKHRLPEPPAAAVAEAQHTTPALEIMQAAFSPFGLSPLHVKVIEGESSGSDVIVRFNPPSENAAMMSPEAEERVLKGAVAALREAGFWTDTEQDVVGAAVRLHIESSPQTLNAKPSQEMLQNLRQAALRLRDEGRQQGD